MDKIGLNFVIIGIMVSVYFLMMAREIDKISAALKRIEKKQDSAEKDRVRE